MAGESIIRIMCPNLSCKRVLGVPAHARGKLVRCRGCGSNIKIPEAKTVVVDGAAAPPLPPKASEAA